MSRKTICAPTGTLVLEKLSPPETALTIYWKNGKLVTTNGPYAETIEQIGGFFVLEAPDMNDAIELMSQHPALKFGGVIRDTSSRR